MRSPALGILLSAAMLLAAITVAGTASAQAGFLCERDAAGELVCWFVDENGDPWEPPPDPPAALNLLSADRIVGNSGSQCTGPGDTDPCTSASNSMRPSSPFADFDGQAWAFETGAFQTSHVHDTELHLEGYVYKGGDADRYYAYSYSRFDVTFDVDRDAQYRLDWLFTGYVDSPEFHVLEDGIKIFEFGYQDPLENSMLFDLVAGRSYALHFLFDSDNTYGYDGGDYDITFSAVPEPGTALLVGLGCVVIAWRRRA
jgi:hypothetical protein